CARRQESLDVW
nr:immunoglobulin heavy chain junction region [Macaca mulatta]MOY19827.1 immunoglobulin heavy chain junction region [Macaca mulatta]MOY20591.1 immunoglobulin heavy chain junction region [Macaca mulatta]